MITPQEVASLKSQLGDPIELMWELSSTNFNDVNGVMVREAHQSGGGEGQGEHVHLVVEVQNPNDPSETVFFESHGAYYSHHGIDYMDSFSQVYPHVVLTTVYRSEPQDERDQL